MSEKITITYHFVSGKYINVIYSKESIPEFIEKLKKGWNACTSITEEFGINFSLVTHYEIK